MAKDAASDKKSCRRHSGAAHGACICMSSPLNCIATY